MHTLKQSDASNKKQKYYIQYLAFGQKSKKNPTKTWTLIEEN